MGGKVNKDEFKAHRRRIKPFVSAELFINGRYGMITSHSYRSPMASLLTIWSAVTIVTTVSIFQTGRNLTCILASFRLKTLVDVKLPERRTR